MIEIYRDTKKIKYQANNGLYHLIQQIDELVQRCAERAYNRYALDNDNPKQMLWSEEINRYLRGEKWLWMNMRYGYAVEEMVNQELSAQNNVAAHGYRLQLQATHGSTRPDIVIMNFYNSEVAWLDITSENNAGHIYRKDGSGWNTTEFVAELLYETFDINKLRDSDDIGIGVRARTLSVSRKASIRKSHLINHMVFKLNYALATFCETENQSKAMLAQSMEQAFNCEFKGYRKHPAIKSMLKKYLEIHTSSHYADLIRSLLNSYYQNDRQDLALAMRFISDSYDYEQEMQRIYCDNDNFDDYLA